MNSTNESLELDEELERLHRWAASLRRSSIATRGEAEKHGKDWEFYDLSIASSAAQEDQASVMERRISALRPPVS